LSCGRTSVGKFNSPKWRLETPHQGCCCQDWQERAREVARAGIVGLADLVGASLDSGDELDALLKSGSCCGLRDARVLDLPPLPLSRRVN
jgi:hypothetical protein